MRTTLHELRRAIIGELTRSGNDAWKAAVFEAVPEGSTDRIVISRTPLRGLQNVTGALEPGNKPEDSFWWGIGRSWIDWTLDEMPDWFYASRYVYAIRVTGSVLRIASVAEFKSFNKEFRSKNDDWSVDWPKVAERYSGIEIAPYFYQFRFSKGMNWYYSWDVASGAAWDPSGVSGKKLLLSR